LRNNQDSKSSDFAAGAALSQDSIRGFSEREAEMPSFFEKQAAEAVVVKNAGQLTLVCPCLPPEIS